MLTGLVRCRICGRTLRVKSRKTATCQRNGCTCRAALVDLEETVRKAIEDKRTECREKLDNLESETTEVRALEAELKDLSDMMLQSYEEYVEGRYAVEDFLRDRDNLGKKMEKLILISI